MSENKILTVFGKPKTGDIIKRDVRNYNFVLQVGEQVKIFFSEETAHAVVISVSGTTASLKVL